MVVAYAHARTGVKFDAGGGNDDMTLWAEAINATGRVMMLENCNDGGDVPYKGHEGCPFNMFRTVRKRPFFVHFVYTMIILPRQARDKHRANSDLKDGLGRASTTRRRLCR